MRNDSFFAGLNPFRTLRAAALALPLALASALPAAASVATPGKPSFNDPGTIAATPGGTLTIGVEEIFVNTGTNPRFEGAGFPNPEYIDGSSGLPFEGVADTLTVTVLTESELNDLPAPPPATFTFTAEVTMTNDEGQYASGTLTFQTTYSRESDSITAQPEPPTPEPAFTLDDGPLLAPPGQRIPLKAEWAFDHAGTNPRFTDAVFSTTEYHDIHEIVNGVLNVRAMTAAQLNALASPPSSPFSVTVDVTMTNDEGQTATGTITFATAYERTVAPTPVQPAGPTFSLTGTRDAPAGLLLSLSADRAFANAGTNPRFTKAKFSTTAYYNTHRISQGVLWVEAKTAAELNALASPPASPIEVTVEVAMTNDEGETASGTITYRTTYIREDSASAPDNGSGGPTYSWVSELYLTPNDGFVYPVTSLFDNAGTNPRLTEAVFSATEYYRSHGISDDGTSLTIGTKTAAELNALPSPPPSTFRVTVTVTMANDEGQTASGTFTVRTAYDRDSSLPTEPEPVPVPPPSFKLTEPWWHQPGLLSEIGAGSLFANPGTNARITEAVFSTREYFHFGSIGRTGVRHGKLFVLAKTAEELNALSPPPPADFYVPARVTMVNDEGQTAKGTVTFWVSYKRIDPEEPDEEAAEGAPALKAEWAAISLWPGGSPAYRAERMFANAGTNPRFTDVQFSTTEYYDRHEIHRGRIYVTAKTAAELNALRTPPPSPFRVDVTVTMTNDEGQTASGTVMIETTYLRIAPPSFTQTGTLTAAPGRTLTFAVGDLFDNMGTNPRFEGAGSPDVKYLDTIRVDETLRVTVLSKAALNALPTPPPSPFTFTVDVTMTNDEGRHVSGTLTFETTYTRDDAQ